ncbi:MAG: hypothetical protein SF097_12100 [Acidobacteriota bacterium]|nr:hypothetical protein [Acidobacteriota bacterium]
MNSDPIIEELHQVRERFAARFNYDVAAMVAYLRQQQEKEINHPVVSFAQPRHEAEEPASDLTLKQAA